MRLKFVIILFCSLLNSSNPNESVFEVVQAALEAANEVIENILNGVHVTLEELKLAANEAAIEASQTATDLISDVNNRLFEKLDKIGNNNTTSEDIEVLYCIENAVDSVVQIEDLSINSTAACINDKLEQALNAYETIWNDIKIRNDGLKNIQNQLVACQDETNISDCVSDLLRNIVEEVRNVTSIVSEDIELANALFISLGQQLDRCIDDQVELLYIEGNKVLSNVEDCFKS